jgi:Penicillin binding protein transpeptidase domain
VSTARRELSDERRRRLTHRALPALGVAVLVVALLALVLAGGGTSDRAAGAHRFALAWQRSDYGAMYDRLTDRARKLFPRAAFERHYRRAAATSTLTSLRVTGRATDIDEGASVPVTMRTRVFGILRGRLIVKMSGDRVKWSPRLVFPGLLRGELLTRRSAPPRRAAILARDGGAIVSGPADDRRPSGAGGAIAGETGRGKTAAEREAAYARGFPHSWPVGRGGLEAMLEEEVAGTPGGKLLTGPRVVATAAPRAADSVRSTIDLGLESAAQTALAGRLGGIAVLDAKTGQVRALAGIAFSAPQPPGSTFKIVTLAAALEGKVAKTSTPYPVSTAALIDGVRLENANGESCGGSVGVAFVHSCNSVYAPLGVKVGRERLVAMAERFGWNRTPPFPGARPSTIPKADAIGSELALGSSAIGQGKVLATPLQLAMVAQTIAAGGRMREPTIGPGRLPRPRRVISTHTAHVIRKLMVGVVAEGTGVSANLGAGVVAGKTGTAELESTTGPTADETPDVRSHTDAWFTAFAPAKKPRIVVAVMLVRAGAGGETAAPAARLVLQQTLGD